MTWNVSRRVFLRGSGMAALGVGLSPSSLLVRTAPEQARHKGLPWVISDMHAPGITVRPFSTIDRGAEPRPPAASLPRHTSEPARPDRAALMTAAAAIAVRVLDGLDQHLAASAAAAT